MPSSNVYANGWKNENSPFVSNKTLFQKKKKKENNSSNNNENANFLLTHILKCKKNKKRTFSLFCHFFRNICVHLLPFFVTFHYVYFILPLPTPGHDTHPRHFTNLRKYQMPSVCHRSHIYAATSIPPPQNP